MPVHGVLGASLATRTSALKPGKSLADGEQWVTLRQGIRQSHGAGRAGAGPEGVGASPPRESVYGVTLFLCGLFW